MGFDTWKRNPGTASLSALLESVEPRIYRICRRILRDAHDAEEAKQEVLLEVVAGVESIADETHFDRWVGKVAFRTALDRRRMRLRREAREREAVRPANGAARDDALHEGMARLDDEDRELLIERYFDRRTLREIAGRRGISAVAVRNRISGAQGRLKRLLGGIPLILLAGASGVNAKTAIAVAIVLLALLGIGVIHRSAKPIVPATGEAMSSLAHAVSPDSGPPSNDPTNNKPSPEGSATAEHVRRRQALIEKLTRYAALVAQDREEARNGKLTGMLGPEDDLQHAIAALWKELKNEVALDPEPCVDFLLGPEGDLIAFDLLDFLKKAAASEMESEESRSGPILKAVMDWGAGNPARTRKVLRFLEDLDRVNGDAADFCLKALSNADPEVRYDAIHAFGEKALRGHWPASIGRHARQFEQLAVAGPTEATRLYALCSLSVVGLQETDEFVLSRFEVHSTTPESWTAAAAMVRLAPRIFPAHEERVSLALKRVLEVPYNDLSYVHWIRLSLHMSQDRCVDILRYASDRVPQYQEVLAEGLEGLVRCVKAGKAQDVLREIERLKRETGAVSQWAITGATRKIVPTLQ